MAWILAAVFWATGSLGKTAAFALPLPIHAVWRSELGFLAILLFWWRVYPTMVAARTFWLAVAVAVATEVALVTWRSVRRPKLDPITAIQMLYRGR